MFPKILHVVRHVYKTAAVGVRAMGSSVTWREGRPNRDVTTFLGQIWPVMVLRVVSKQMEQLDGIFDIESLVCGERTEICVA